ncbi:hypothetical protein [Photobacterium damselae]|uniref:hypothetical protein n=1 Tax=Photobacterium damselae TaxID=38293 RepID=UPI004068CEE4
MKSISTSAQQVSSTVFKWSSNGTIDTIAKMNHNSPLIVVNIPAFVRKTLGVEKDTIKSMVAYAMCAGDFSYLSIAPDEISSSSPRCYESCEKGFTNMMIICNSRDITFAVPFLKSEIENMSDEERIKAAVDKINKGECEIAH